MERKPKICVIMSTYNGESFLTEQIDSILAQKDVDVTLHIYDDCSKDNTVEIAKKYEQKNENVFVHVNEQNKNFTYNFLDALFSFKDNQEFEYYAFSDQDDYWIDDKLITAVNKIKETGKCTLYSSNLKIVDQDLNYDGNNMMSLKYKNKHYDVICNNVVTGCTAVFDNEFKNLVTKHYPKNIYLHDYWLALLANYCEYSHFIYDVCPDHILYRQHGDNQIGKKKEFIFKHIARIILRPIDKKKCASKLVEEFFKLYHEDISSIDFEIIKTLANYHKFKNKMKCLTKIYSNYSFMFKIYILVGKY